MNRPLPANRPRLRPRARHRRRRPGCPRHHRRPRRHPRRRARAVRARASAFRFLRDRPPCKAEPPAAIAKRPPKGDREPHSAASPSPTWQRLDTPNSVVPNRRHHWRPPTTWRSPSRSASCPPCATPPDTLPSRTTAGCCCCPGCEARSRRRAPGPPLQAHHLRHHHRRDPGRFDEGPRSPRRRHPFADARDRRRLRRCPPVEREAGQARGTASGNRPIACRRDGGRLRPRWRRRTLVVGGRHVVGPGAFVLFCGHGHPTVEVGRGRGDREQRGLHLACLLRLPSGLPSARPGVRPARCPGGRRRRSAVE